jgi:hypothetical protein
MSELLGFERSVWLKWYLRVSEIGDVIKQGGHMRENAKALNLS